MTQRSRALGRLGEAQAARYLAQRGYRILASNVRAGGVELDVVAAARPRVVAFVEVKTRSQHCGTGRRCSPSTLASRRASRAARRPGCANTRRSELRRDAARALRRHRLPLRADDTWTIEHWPGAFDAS